MLHVLRVAAMLLCSTGTATHMCLVHFVVPFVPMHTKCQCSGSIGQKPALAGSSQVSSSSVMPGVHFALGIRSVVSLRLGCPSSCLDAPSVLAFCNGELLIALHVLVDVMASQLVIILITP